MSIILELLWSLRGNVKKDPAQTVGALWSRFCPSAVTLRDEPTAQLLVIRHTYSTGSRLPPLQQHRKTFRASYVLITNMLHQLYRLMSTGVASSGPSPLSETVASPFDSGLP